jgi:hypothetical protein
MVRNRTLAIVGALGLSLALAVMHIAASDDVNKKPGKPAATAASDDVNKKPGKPAATAAKQNPPQAPAQGVRVFIDPATGKIREPEPEEIQQLTPAAPAAARRSTAPSGAALHGRGGAVGMRLDDSQMVYSVATKNADGTISFECVTGAANASQKLTNKPNEGRQPDVK